ncbi:phosphoglycerate mutase-like protein [Xylariaceae sp. FL0016]|nr:phosphoglycerate mutase-like protein [Xylariaceae sp. FL0016]
MAPTIDVIRHAESYHNVDPAHRNTRDPNLTPHGREQCRALAQTYPHMRHVSHLVASPLNRCVSTAVIAFGDAVSAGKQAILLPELQETGNMPTDTGSDREAIQFMYGSQVDVSELDSNWSYRGPGSFYTPDLALVEERARQARLFIRNLARQARDDAHIVVVSHGGFLHFLTQDFAGIGGRYFTSYGNLTMRSFHFDDLHGQDSVAAMSETPSSQEKNNFNCWSTLSEEERRIAKACATRRVEAQKAWFEKTAASEGASG